MQATTPKQNSETDLAAKSLEDMLSNLSQNLADNNASLEASHKTKFENLQQQLHSLKDLVEKKFANLQEQLGNTKSSLTIKDKDFIYLI